MTEPRVLGLPMIGYAGGNVAAARAVFDLHAPRFLPVGRTAFPDDLLFTDVKAGLQFPMTIPAGVNARIVLELDPGGRYLAEAGDFLHGVEDCTSRDKMILRAIPVVSGQASFISVAPCLLGPTCYRKGDRLLAYVEGQGLNLVSDLWSFFGLVSPGDGHWPLDEGVAYAVPCNNSAAQAMASCRSVLRTKGVAGSHGQLHVTAPTGGARIAHVSIGKWTGPGPNMAAAPVPVLWNGSAALNLAEGADLWSDVYALNVAAGDDLIVDINVTSGGAWPFKNVGQVASWLSDTTANYGQQNMTNYVQQGPTNTYPAPVTGRVHGPDAVKVLP